MYFYARYGREQLVRCCPSLMPEAVWRRFVHSDLTLFMAVPTIYIKLIAAWEKTTREEQQVLSKACSKMRLMVSGPAAVFERWKVISGHTLLERYGMTEIGMALSNPLHGERRPGFVGCLYLRSKCDWLMSPLVP